MATLSKDKIVIETNLPTEITRLKSQGFTEVKHDEGGPLTAGLTVLINETGRAEHVTKPAPKSTK